jgi:hypothetical protein
MAVLAKRPVYRVIGDLTVRGRGDDDLIRTFQTGDELPVEVAATLNQRELDALLGMGRLQEIGVKRAPRPAEKPPTPPTVAETLRSAGWWDATVKDGRIVNGPPGCEIVVLSRTPRDADLKPVLGVGTDTPVVVHPVDGVSVATISLARLAELLAGRYVQRLVR